MDLRVLLAICFLFRSGSGMRTMMIFEEELYRCGNDRAGQSIGGKGNDS